MENCPAPRRGGVQRAECQRMLCRRRSRRRANVGIRCEDTGVLSSGRNRTSRHARSMIADSHDNLLRTRCCSREATEINEKYTSEVLGPGSCPSSPNWGPQCFSDSCPRHLSRCLYVLTFARRKLGLQELPNADQPPEQMLETINNLPRKVSREAGWLQDQMSASEQTPLASRLTPCRTNP
jgi:hypothetical protein